MSMETLRIQAIKDHHPFDITHEKTIRFKPGDFEPVRTPGTRCEEPVIMLPDLEEIIRNSRADRDRRGTPWADREIAILKRYYGRVPVCVLAKQLDRSIRSVTNQGYAQGLTGRKRRGERTD